MSAMNLKFFYRYPAVAAILELKATQETVYMYKLSQVSEFALYVLSLLLKIPRTSLLKVTINAEPFPLSPYVCVSSLIFCVGEE